MADQAAEGLLSPFLRKKRIEVVRPYIKGRILDVGCGSGGLAGFVDHESYCGVEIDGLSLRRAKELNPKHRFVMDIDDVDSDFDTVVALAVIEHVSSPADFLIKLSRKLIPSAKGGVIITTPHPYVDWLHGLGASMGLFSKHANEEHEELLNRSLLEKAGKEAGMRLNIYRRFLCGANQIAIFHNYN